MNERIHRATGLTVKGADTQHLLETVLHIYFTDFSGVSRGKKKKNPTCRLFKNFFQLEHYFELKHVRDYEIFM